MAEYFDDAYTRDIASLDATFTAHTEWPTWLLIVLTYGGWLAVVRCVHSGPLSKPAATPLLILLCTWHMSLQHELLHGHPTRPALVNKLLGSIPLAIRYPYASIAIDHVLPERWVTATAWQRVIWRMRKRFVGRLMVGPPLSVVTLLAGAVDERRRGDRRYAAT